MASNSVPVFDFTFDPSTGRIVPRAIGPGGAGSDVIGVTDGYETDVLAVGEIPELTIRGIPRERWQPSNGRAGAFDFFGLGGFVDRISVKFGIPKWLVVLLMVIATVEALKQLDVKAA